MVELVELPVSKDSIAMHQIKPMKDLSGVLELLLSSLGVISQPPLTLIPFSQIICEAHINFSMQHGKRNQRCVVESWTCEDYALWVTHSILFPVEGFSYRCSSCFEYLLLHKLSSVKQHQ
jgi:hypothetical protein